MFKVSWPLVVEAAMHMVLYFSAMSAMMFIFMYKVEKTDLSYRINQAVAQVFQDHGIPMPVVNDQTRAVFSVPMRETALNNQYVMEETIMLNIMLLMLSCFLIGIAFAFHRKEVQFGKLLLTNALMMIFVGVVEVYFFLTIATAYAPVPPSFMTNYIIANLTPLL